MIIVPTDYITSEILAAENFVPALEEVCTGKGTTITKIETNSEGAEIVPYLDEDENYYYNGIIDVSYENTNRDFTGIAYIKTTGDSVTYEYAAFACERNENGEAIANTESYLNNSRSIAEIASAALNETREKYVVTGTRREVCVSYVNDALTRAAKLPQDSEIDGLFAINGDGALAPNGEETLSLATAADLRLNWSSSDDVVATVDGGKVTVGEYVGKATITASIGNGETTDFAATKDVTSKASTGTFKWTENSKNTVMSEYNAHQTNRDETEYLPANTSVTTVDGINVLAVKAGSMYSLPAIIFNQNNAFFNMTKNSIVSFKIKVSDGAYMSGLGGVYFSNYETEVTGTSNGNADATNTAIYNEMMNISASTTLVSTSGANNGFVPRTIYTSDGAKRQVVYALSPMASSISTETQIGEDENGWTEISIVFPNGNYLNNFMISFASTNAAIADKGVNNYYYISDITVTEKVDKTKLTYFGASLQGIDAINGTYPAELSIDETENALKVSASEQFKQTTGVYCLPGVQFGDNDYQLTEASEISFKIRISDNFVSKSNNAGIIITYEGVGENSTIGNYIASATNDCALITSKTQTIDAVNRFNDGSKTPQYVLTVSEAESATTNARQWVTITLKLASGNLKLSGLRILFNSAHSTSTYIDSNGKDNYILIKDFTVK
ncbi:MAG: hypothetical protein IJX91_03525 [Clostridia bacterium]|nr:hypothetical protein [Clostridia bacterium]